MFDRYLDRWNLIPDGMPIITRSSRLLPVRRGGVPAMLKIAVEAEERRGGALMVWWAGEGAARVLAHEGEALLMERAMGERSLIEMARHGRDEEACRIICSVAGRLHDHRGRPAHELIPLSRWFAALEPAAARYGGTLGRCAAMARALLGAPRDAVVLHGDIHHGNILDAGDRGWLAVDPKGLAGERGFDFANIFCNPDRRVAAAPGRLARQASVVAEAAGLDRERLLGWALAWAGLSAAWFIEDGMSPDVPLEVAEIAAAELGLSSPPPGP